jgi:hypothetical protein
MTAYAEVTKNNRRSFAALKMTVPEEESEAGE